MWYGLYLSGELRNPKAVRKLSELCDVVWAADGGLDRALALGIEPAYWVGDQDSLSKQGSEWLIKHQERVQVLPEKKDWTDSEYALREILKNENTSASTGMVHPELPSESGLMLLAALGIRYDHVLANLDLAAKMARPDLPVLMTDGHCCIWTLKAPFRMKLEWPKRSKHCKHHDCRKYFSLISVSDLCEGIHLQGAMWELKDATLERGINLGISNEPAGKETLLQFQKGTMRLILDRESKEESREWTLLRD